MNWEVVEGNLTHYGYKKAQPSKEVDKLISKFKSKKTAK
jgi:hypothetical protein